MHVRVPACCEWDTHLPRKIRREHAEFAWPGHVDHVRLEVAQGALNAAGIPHKQWVKAEVFFHADGCTAAWQFQCRHRAFAHQHRADTHARQRGPNAQERQSMPMRIRLEVTCGMRDAIHLVKRIGEERHAQSCAHACLLCRCVVAMPAHYQTPS